jgi:cytochrome c oxidase cbb3-type subunit 3
MASEVREHEFDGIHEYDNRLPNWWLWTFYGACIFSLFYWLHFHVLGTGALPGEEYRLEMEEAAQRNVTSVVTDDSLRALAADAAAVAAGREVFRTNCVGCHADNGGAMLGAVPLPGPNLTDRFWIHGGAPAQIHHTITHGVPQKGMVQWGPQLGGARVQQVTAYVLSLRNSDVAGGKAPQGDSYDGS